MQEAALVEEDAERILTIPGIEPIITASFLAYAPEMEGFMQGRDFAAWPAASFPSGIRPAARRGRPTQASWGNPTYDVRY